MPRTNCVQRFLALGVRFSYKLCMKQLEAWMTENNVDDAALAARVGISRVQVSRIRRDINRPRPALARKLSAVTSIPQEVFIFGGQA